MKKWYLIGFIGEMKAYYYVGEFATETEAKEHAIKRYKLNKRQAQNIILESKEGQNNGLQECYCSSQFR